jgi:hypothetical protein
MPAPAIQLLGLACADNYDLLKALAFFMLLE